VELWNRQSVKKRSSGPGPELIPGMYGLNVLTTEPATPVLGPSPPSPDKALEPRKEEGGVLNRQAAYSIFRSGEASSGPSRSRPQTTQRRSTG
jgi:hypothetical protein